MVITVRISFQTTYLRAFDNTQKTKIKNSKTNNTNMKSKLTRIALPLAVGAFTLVGCDDAYDLSDIDSTVELQVKDLVIPVNIDEILMENIINLDENSQIKIDGNEYVIIDNGDFESDVIEIDEVILKVGKVDPAFNTVVLENAPEIPMPTNYMTDIELVYPIGQSLSDFDYENSNDIEYIVDIEEAGTIFNVKLTFNILDIDNVLNSYSLKDLKFRIPKGLDITTTNGTYDATTGLLSIYDKKYTSSSIDFKFTVNNINIKQAGIDFKYNETTNKSTCSFKDQIGINSGEIIITEEDFAEGADLTQMPNEIKLRTDFDLSDIEVTTFTGKVNYALDGIDIAPIQMGEIPEVLSQSETDIRLVNPQVYFKLNNPVANYKLEAQAHVTVTANRPEGSKTFAIDNQYFTIGYDSSKPEDYKYPFCMSPSIPEKTYPGYEDYTHIPFTDLANVLSGNGLPTSFNVTLDNAKLPTQYVEDFKLGQDLGKVAGDYTLYVPIELGAGSKIVYTSTETGWNSEEIDDIIISSLQIDALVTNDLPLDLIITAYPIDKDGNQISDIHIEGFEVKEGDVDRTMTIKVTTNEENKITHLDGISFTAIATPGPDLYTLKPSEHIVLKNLKIKVSGNYSTEL